MIAVVMSHRIEPFESSAHVDTIAAGIKASSLGTRFLICHQLGPNHLVRRLGPPTQGRKRSHANSPLSP